MSAKYPPYSRPAGVFNPLDFQSSYNAVHDDGDILSADNTWHGTNTFAAQTIEFQAPKLDIEFINGLSAMGASDLDALNVTNLNTGAGTSTFDTLISNSSTLAPTFDAATTIRAPDLDVRGPRPLYATIANGVETTYYYDTQIPYTIFVNSTGGTTNVYLPDIADMPSDNRRVRFIMVKKVGGSVIVRVRNNTLDSLIIGMDNTSVASPVGTRNNSGSNFSPFVFEWDHSVSQWKCFGWLLTSANNIVSLL